MEARGSELQGARVGGQRWDVFQVDRAETDEGTKRIVPKTVWIGPEFANESGTLEVKRLLGKDVFTNPKPLGLVKYLLEQATGPDDLILDFFAGSGTTAHAVMAQNHADGGRRRFLLVQLPEKVQNGGYDTIADITRARVRKAGEQFAAASTLRQPDADLGFRSYRLSSSNFSAWEPSSVDGETVALRLELHANNLTQGRSDEDRLAELLVKAGYPLTASVEELSLANKRVFSVEDHDLLLCFEPALTIELFEAMIELEPSLVIVLDAGFANDDQLKVNALQTIRSRITDAQTSTELKVI